MNWLRVFSNAEASRFGQGVGQQRTGCEFSVGQKLLAWASRKMWGTPWESGGEHVREGRVFVAYARLLPSSRIEPFSPTTSRGEVTVNWLRVLLIGVTSCKVRRKCTPMRFVQLWSAQAKHAGLRRIPSDTLPRHAAYIADGPTRGSRSWPPL